MSITPTSPEVLGTTTNDPHAKLHRAHLYGHRTICSAKTITTVTTTVDGLGSPALMAALDRADHEPSLLCRRCFAPVITIPYTEQYNARHHQPAPHTKPHPAAPPSRDTTADTGRDTGEDITVDEKPGASPVTSIGTPPERDIERDTEADITADGDAAPARLTWEAAGHHGTIHTSEDTVTILLDNHPILGIDLTTGTIGTWPDGETWFPVATIITPPAPRHLSLITSHEAKVIHLPPRPQ